MAREEFIETFPCPRTVILKAWLFLVIPVLAQLACQEIALVERLAYCGLTQCQASLRLRWSSGK